MPEQTWLTFDETERRILEMHTYPEGRAAVRMVLEEMIGQWVPRDYIQVKTGQRDVRTRISELRHKEHLPIVHNHRAGGASAYMLLPGRDAAWDGG